MSDKKLTLLLVSQVVEGDVREVKTVDVSKRELDSIDEDINACVELRKLNLSNNKISTLKPLRDNKLLTWLNVSNNRLRSLDGVQTLSVLSTLNASHNQILRLDHATQIPALKALVLNNNKIKVVSGLSKLKEANAIVLSHNEIEEVGDLELSGLTELRKVSLSHNQLRVVPSLSNCHALKELRLNENKIMSLPPALSLNIHLRILDVGNNVLAKFQDIEVIKELKFLVNLNLRGNPVTNLEGYREKVLGWVPSLQILDGKPIDTRKKTKKQTEASDLTDADRNQARGDKPRGSGRARGRARGQGGRGRGRGMKQADALGGDAKPDGAQATGADPKEQARGRGRGRARGQGGRGRGRGRGMKQVNALGGDAKPDGAQATGADPNEHAKGRGRGRARGLGRGRGMNRGRGRGRGAPASNKPDTAKATSEANGKDGPSSTGKVKAAAPQKRSATESATTMQKLKRSKKTAQVA